WNNCALVAACDHQHQRDSVLSFCGRSNLETGWEIGMPRTAKSRSLVALQKTQLSLGMTAENKAWKESGVTLIELLVVVTIIALFAALVGPRLFRQVGRSRTTAAKAQINAFQTALGVYKLDTGKFPTTEQGLRALRAQPDGVERWDGPYLPQDAPPDPW